MKKNRNEDTHKSIPIKLGVGSVLFNAAYTAQYTADLYQDRQLHFDTALWTCEAVGSDDFPTFTIQNGALWDFGGELVFNRKKQMSFSKPKETIVNSIEDIGRLEVPDIRKAPAFQRQVEFADIQRAHGMKVTVKGGSMLELMQPLAGTSNILKWLIKEPESMHIFYRKITDYIFSGIDFYIERYGADNVVVLDTYQLDNDYMISRKTFERMSLPYIMELHNRYCDMNLGGWTLHLCGDHRESLRYWLNDIKLHPKTLFYIGTEMDMKKTAKLIGDSYSIGGNVPNTLIQSGRPNELYKYTKELVLSMKHNPGGFVLMPDCSLTPQAPPVNIYAIVKAGREFGNL